MSTKRNILISGLPGSGKTTVVRRLLELLPQVAVTGFYTEEIREGRKRTGFAAQLVGGPRIVLARASGAGRYRVGRYAVEVAAFEEVVLRPFAAALKDPSRRFLVIDENRKDGVVHPFLRGTGPGLAGRPAPPGGHGHAGAAPLCGPDQGQAGR